jgi:hypothetical protein
VILVSLAQSCFESAMYMFLFILTPVLEAVSSRPRSPLSTSILVLLFSIIDRQHVPPIGDHSCKSPPSCHHSIQSSSSGDFFTDKFEKSSHFCVRYVHF